jgi:hypothetical protein
MVNACCRQPRRWYFFLASLLAAGLVARTVVHAPTALMTRSHWSLPVADEACLGGSTIACEFQAPLGSLANKIRWYATACALGSAPSCFLLTRLTADHDLRILARGCQLDADFNYEGFGWSNDAPCAVFEEKQIRRDPIKLRWLARVADQGLLTITQQDCKTGSIPDCYQHAYQLCLEASDQDHVVGSNGGFRDSSSSLKGYNCDAGDVWVGPEQRPRWEKLPNKDDVQRILEVYRVTCNRQDADSCREAKRAIGAIGNGGN